MCPSFLYNIINHEKLQIPSSNQELLAPFFKDLLGYFCSFHKHNIYNTPKSAKSLIRLWKGIQSKKKEILLDKIQFTVELGIENYQISGCLHFFS